MKRFDVITIGGAKNFISKGEPVKYLLAEEIFDIIESTHIATRHGRRDKMNMETLRKYGNITIATINRFLSLCDP